MPQGSPLDPFAIARILRLAKTMSINATAKATGHTRNTVKKILKKFQQTALTKDQQTKET